MSKEKRSTPTPPTLEVVSVHPGSAEQAEATYGRVSTRLGKPKAPKKPATRRARLEGRSTGIGRIGVLAGTFDPVHKGHISFALQAIQAASLDKVVFVPEPKPRHKPDVTHLSHRLKMLEIACSAYDKLEVYQLPSKQFTVANSLPKLRQAYPESELVFLMGADVLAHLSVWPNVRGLLRAHGLVVSVHGQKDEREAFKLLANLPIEPKEVHVVTSQYKAAASRQIRADIKAGKKVDDVLGTVQAYAKDNWLYTSLNS